MRIGLTYDLKTQYPFKATDPADANAEFDHPDTLRLIEEGLCTLGYEVIRIGNVKRLLEVIDRLDVDLVFNLAEGYAGRNREAQVPILLEMKGIPFVGSDGLTLALTLDKLMAKKMLIAEGIPTPAYLELSRPEDPFAGNLPFPMIVKPRYEGSSKGLSERSLVRSASELRSQAAWVIETYHQPALVEQFIRGREYTVALIGNEEPEVLPVVQVRIGGQLELGELFYTHGRIASGADYVCPAAIELPLEQALRETALRAYQALECRDFGRVDFRVDERGDFYVLEINPLPSLSTEDVFGILTRPLGVSYENILGRIVESARERLGLVQETVRELHPL